jgi:hypothetical protein
LPPGLREEEITRYPLVVHVWVLVSNVFSAIKVCYPLIYFTWQCTEFCSFCYNFNISPRYHCNMISWISHQIDNTPPHPVGFIFFYIETVRLSLTFYWNIIWGILNWLDFHLLEHMTHHQLQILYLLQFSNGYTYFNIPEITFSAMSDYMWQRGWFRYLVHGLVEYV